MMDNRKQEYTVNPPSVLARIFIFILLIICQFYTDSENHVGIKIVDSGLNNTFIMSIKSFKYTQNS